MCQTSLKVLISGDHIQVQKEHMTCPRSFGCSGPNQDSIRTVLLYKQMSASLPQFPLDHFQILSIECESSALHVLIQFILQATLYRGYDSHLHLRDEEREAEQLSHLLELT